jgi:hypothetical protein
MQDAGHPKLCCPPVDKFPLDFLFKGSTSLANQHNCELCKLSILE